MNANHVNWLVVNHFRCCEILILGDRLVHQILSLGNHIDYYLPWLVDHIFCRIVVTSHLAIESESLVHF